MGYGEQDKTLRNRNAKLSSELLGFCFCGLSQGRF